jgi:PhnB protein
MMMRYKESPRAENERMVAPCFDDKVMHATFRIGGSTLMASDGMC